MRQVYSTLLPIAGDPTDSCIAAEELALAWAFRNHGGVPQDRERSAGTWSSGPTEITWRTLEVERGNLCVWTLTWRHPHDVDPDLGWHSEVKVGRHSESAWIFVRVGLLPITHRVRPIEFRFSPPRIVADLADKLDVRVDGWQMRGRARGLWTADIDDLVAFLQDDSRVLPVVVASTLPDGQPVIDANRAASRLLGLAHVTVLGDASTAFQLTDLVGKERSVYNGAVRLYYPGFSLTCDPFDHPLWLPGKIREHQQQGNSFEGFLLSRLAALAAMRTPVPALESVILKRHTDRRRAELDELRSRVESGQLEAQALEDQLLASWNDNDATAKQLEELRSELTDARENLIQIIASKGDAQGPVAEEPEPEPSRTVIEAVRRAQDQAQCLVFLEEAIESAERCGYRQAEKILDALRTLDEVAGRYHRKGPMPQGIDGALREAGLEYAGNVSVTTRGKYKREYQRTYDGRTISLGPHIKLGKGSPDTCARVYFFKDQDKRRLVVGHIGQHLSDSTTG